MKIQYFLFIALSCLLQSCGRNETVSPKITETLKMHYDAPAKYFEEALPIGNGMMGAMVYGGVEMERISLADAMLWTGGPDLKTYTPNAHQYLSKVRKCLQEEDYAGAEEANRLIEGHNSEIFQPLGTLWVQDLHAAGQVVSHYERELDLNNAVASVAYTTADGVKMQRNYFLSAPDSVLVVRLKSEQAPLNERVTLTTAQRVLTRLAASNQDTALFEGRGGLSLEGYTAYSTKKEKGKEDEWFHYDAQKGIHFRTEMHVLAPEGCVLYETDSTLLIQNCDEAVLVLTNATSFNGSYKDPVKRGRNYPLLVSQRLESACAADYNELLERHEKDYQQLFGRVSLQLGMTADTLRALPTDQQLLQYTDEATFNPELEALYFQYGRYLLISMSRTKGVPGGLQGLWNESLTPPWSGNYTTNINLEENYWPAETGALPEMHEALLEWIMQLPRSGAITAANYYGIYTPANAGKGVRSWCMCHNSDLWSMTNPVGYQEESPQWACWPMGGVWLCTHLWEHYTFTQDYDFLTRAYPVMKGAALFALDWLQEKDGYLITAPSTSPENRYINAEGVEASTCYGGTADLAMIRELFLDTKHAATVLGMDDTKFQERIENALGRLFPYQVGCEGNLQEWYYDWQDKDPHHRHQSHLFGLYPGHHIQLGEDKEIAEAAGRTLDLKGEVTTGWSAGWRVNLRARLHDGEAAYRMLRRLLTYVHPEQYKGEDRRHGGGTYPNLFDAHPPFQIDGNFGGTAGMIEMLVQSRWVNDNTAEVYLLPALPKAWSKGGSISGVRVRGGYEVSMSWEDSKVTHLEVKNLYDKVGTLNVTSSDGQKWTY